MSPDDPLGQRAGDARFSRSGDTHPLGKCDEAIEVALPAAMKADLAAMAHLNTPPMTPAEYARMVLSNHMYGRKAQLQRILDQ